LFRLFWTANSKETLTRIQSDPSLSIPYKAVKKTILLLASNPHHNSLQTHRFFSLKGPAGEKVFESYAQQKTPAAYRIFWYYGPDNNCITIFAIIKHP
jgi:hypothetical protein